MINLYVNRPEHRYETENICRLFFPSEKLSEAQKPQKQTAIPADTNDNAAANSQNNDTEKRLQSNDIAVNVTFDKDDKDGKRSGKLLITAEVFAKGERIIFSENIDITGDEEKDEKTAELAGGRCLYKAFSKICGFSPKWGILTGSDRKSCGRQNRRFSENQLPSSFSETTTLYRRKKSSFAKKRTLPTKGRPLFQSPIHSAFMYRCPFAPAAVNIAPLFPIPSPRRESSFPIMWSFCAKKLKQRQRRLKISV